ncbi:MAG: bifunctional phosphoribosylaminoimidazolecarboxamide formyltransferase/IMP cyclohydrolase, partial [Acidimicrobiales bacterium]
TGAPEMLSGRVKTLHPRIHGGILADLDEPSHRRDLKEQGIEPIGLVVSNLYPFRSEPSVEMIDIGGPAMVRAAAKNHARVAVVVDPSTYGAVLDEIRREGEVGAEMRLLLARGAFAHTAAYDAAIVSWFDSLGASPAPALPASLHLALERCEELRYGENPHQRAARYRPSGGRGGIWEAAGRHGGRELSYLNLFDADAAWRLCNEVALLGGRLGGDDAALAAAVVVKHANPCGAALGTSAERAYEAAVEGDPRSAFGGIVALSSPVGCALAELVVSKPLADVLVAPGFSDEALELFAAKRKNMRTLSVDPPSPPGLSLRQIDGDFLVQEPDLAAGGRDAWQVVTSVRPAAEQWIDIELAWLVCARTWSNAIVLAHAGTIVGVGAGQQSRVDAAGLAARKAGDRAKGGVAASDAFFPFRDGLEAVCEAGVSAVVQPGGSLRDDEVIAAAEELGIAMVLTGERHFRH